MQLLYLFIDSATIFYSSIISEKSFQTLHCIQIESYPMHPAMICFVPLKIMFLRFIHVLVGEAVSSFTWISSVQWNASTKNSLIPYLSGIWAISSLFLLLQIVLLQTFLFYVLGLTYIIFSRVYQGSRLLGIIYEIIQTVVQDGCTNLYSNQQCLRVLIALSLCQHYL